MSGGYIDPYGFSQAAGSSAPKAPPSKAPGYVDPYGFAGTSKGAAKPKAKGGGGVGGFFGHLASDAGHAIAGIPTGVVSIGKNAAHDVAHPKNLVHLGIASGLAAADPLAYKQVGKQLHETSLGRNVVLPMAHQYGHEYGPLAHGHFGQFAHQLYQHPLGPILDALTVATLGAGGVAKAGELASQAGLISEDSALANLAKPVTLETRGLPGTGERIAIKQTSHAPLAKYRQILVNKALNKLPSETPVLGSTARAVRSLQRVAGKEASRLDVQARDFNKAFSKLSKPEKAAFHMRARRLDPVEYGRYLAENGGSKALQKVLADPKIKALYDTPSPALRDALEKGRALDSHLTAARVAAGHLSEQAALEAPYRHMRMMSGARMEPVMGESPTLTAAKAERDTIAAAHEKALQAEEKFLHETRNRDLGSLSPEDAKARLAHLDQQYEQMIQRTVPHVSPYAREQSFRTGRTFDREQLRRNTLKGTQGRSFKSVAQEERDLADQAVRDTISQHPNDPAAQAAARLLHERDTLRAALQQHAEAPIFGHEPGPLPSAPAHAHASVPPPSNPFRDTIVKLGHRLEDANARVAKFEGSQAQTGAYHLVGGKSVEQLIHEIEAQSPLAQYRDLERKVTQAEARVEKAHGPANTSNLDYAHWQDWSRARGYTSAEIADFQKWLDLNKRLGITEPDMMPTAERPFGMSDQGILEHARKAGMTGGEHPFHVPDTAHVPGVRSRFASKPAGYAEPASGVKQSRLTLASQGHINPFDNALGRDFQRYRNQVEAQMLHDELVKHAAILPKGEPVPRGFDVLPLNRGQAALPFTQRIAEPLAHEITDQGLRERLGEMGRTGQVQPRGVSGQFEGPHTLIVPKQVRRLVEDESKSYGSRIAAIRRVPLGVWKGAVLGLRPAFFGNITLGNSILGTLQMAPGRWGMVGWLNQVLPGFEKVAGAKLTDETMKDVFPEQVSGTFGGSVAPHGYHGSSRILRAGSKVAQGVTPAMISYENVLRRAMAEGWAKATPEIQRMIDRNGGDVNAALRQAAKSHPQIVDQISRRIDNALGNYRTYNKFERAIKSVVPFYGWNRHITSSLARLASERPQVLDALMNTGLQGQAQANHIIGALPAYLNQVIPVHLPGALGGENKKGVMTVLDPHAWNPFSTVTDEGRLVASPFTHAGAASDAFPLAPDVQAAIEQMTGKSLLTGAPIKGNAFKDELLNLVPQESLFTRHRKPTSTNQNSRYAQILRILGLPVENINVPAATQKWRTINIPVR